MGQIYTHHTGDKSHHAVYMQYHAMTLSNGLLDTINAAWLNSTRGHSAAACLGSTKLGSTHAVVQAIYIDKYYYFN